MASNVRRMQRVAASTVLQVSVPRLAALRTLENFQSDPLSLVHGYARPEMRPVQRVTHRVPGLIYVCSIAIYLCM